MNLPASILELADRTSSEEAWRPDDFPRVLSLARSNGFACLGGQFQFRGPIGTAEMYWLDADSKERKIGEDWEAYVDRSNQEVLDAFQSRMKETDFDAEARKWHHIVEAIESARIKDPKEYLYFVAYFKSKKESVEPVG